MADLINGIASLLGAPDTSDYTSKQQLLQQNAITLQNQRLAQEQAKALAPQLLAQKKAAFDAKAAWAKDPSNVEKYATYVALNPDDYQAAKAANEALTEEQKRLKIEDSIALYGAAKTKDFATIRSIVQKNLDADKKAGRDIQDDIALLAKVDKAEAGDAIAMSQILMPATLQVHALAPSHFAEANENELTRPLRIQETNAGIKKTQAETDKIIAETELLPTELAIKADEAATKRIAAETGVAAQNDLPTPVYNMVTAASDEASKAYSSANEMKSIADKFEQNASKLSGGSLASAGQLVSGIFGNFTDAEQLRIEAKRIRQQFVLSRLPPGNPTDKETKAALSTTIPDNANPESVARYFRGIAKLQQRLGEAKTIESSWLEQTRGRRSSLSEPIYIETPEGSVRVPPGSSLQAFTSKYFTEKDKAARASQREQDATKR